MILLKSLRIREKVAMISVMIQLFFRNIEQKINSANKKKIMNMKKEIMTLCFKILKLRGPVPSAWTVKKFTKRGKRGKNISRRFLNIIN